MTAVRTASEIHVDLFERAVRVTPGGVHSPVRAFRAVGAQPIALVEAQGARVRDAEGREYVDWIGAWGPLILGHAHPEVVEAVERAARRGLIFGLASPAEVELAERIATRVPGCEMVRLVVTGTEAAMSALRLARAATGRPGVIKFAGCYHGHADSFLIRAGSGAATFQVPDSPGVTAGAIGDTYVARLNDLDSVDTCFASTPERVAAVIVEPVAGNMGCVPPEPGFLLGLRERCNRHGAVLIFDEVITGFRLGSGGAAAHFGVTPDLIAMGKVLGGGMPLAAFGGRRDLMKQICPQGLVYQAGTFAAHPVSVAAALATLDVIDRNPAFYETLEATSATIESGFKTLSAQMPQPPLRVQRVGSMWTPFFTSQPVRSWDDHVTVSTEQYAAFFRAMLSRGVLLPPSQFECSFVSIMHGEDEIRMTLDAAEAALKRMSA